MADDNQLPDAILAGFESFGGWDGIGQGFSPFAVSFLLKAIMASFFL